MRTKWLAAFVIILIATSTVTYGTWWQEAKLTAADAEYTDYFGDSVAIDGSNAVIGAYREGEYSQGAVYVFVDGASEWSQAEKLTALDGALDDRFGQSVSVAGDLILVGATYDDDNGSIGLCIYLPV